jgi:hypothetical protein
MGLHPNSFFNAIIFACILIPLASGVIIPFDASNPELDSVHRPESASSPAVPLVSPHISSIAARAAPATSGGKRLPPLVYPNSSSIDVSPGVGAPSIAGIPNVTWAFVGTDGMGPGVGEGGTSVGPTAVFNHPEIVLGQGGVAPSYMSDNDVRLNNHCWFSVWG